MNFEDLVIHPIHQIQAVYMILSFRTTRVNNNKTFIAIFLQTIGYIQKVIHLKLHCMFGNEKGCNGVGNVCKHKTRFGNEMICLCIMCNE